jgi:SAM-dependent methyltransferase
MECRHCGAELSLPLIDLGAAPPSNAYLPAGALHSPELHLPLRVLVCTDCWLAQTEDFAAAEEYFSPEYAYFSSFSTTWLAHAEAYVEDMVRRFGLGPDSFMVEVASNDGYLLQFAKARGIPCLGIEPTASTAAAARERGIPTLEAFFGRNLGGQLAGERPADLMAANNVLAHVPDINDFVAGFSALLKPDGVATFEFPHLLRLVEENQFDTIYHEHYSYLSLTAVDRIFERNGLTVFDVEEWSTHGGSLRVFAQRRKNGARPREARVDAMIAREREAGMQDPAFYLGLQARAERVKDELLAFLLEAKRNGKTVVGYGAAAKGNTLLNFAGVRADLLSFVADRNPAKQGKFLPGSRIPIRAPEAVLQSRPDYLLILPWNLREEVMAQFPEVPTWGGRFVTAIPALEIR